MTDTIASSPIFSCQRDIAPWLDPGVSYPLHPDQLAKQYYPIKSFISTHGAKYHFQPADSSGTGSDWFFWSLLLGFVLLTFIRFSYQKRLKLMVSAVFSRQAAHQITREGNIFNHQSFLPLLLITMMAYALFFYQVIIHADPSTAQGRAGMILALQAFLIWLGYLFIKISMIRVGSWIFDNASTASAYIQNIFIFNLFSGILLLPFLLAIAYTDLWVFIYASAVIIGLTMIIRFIRGIQIGMADTKFSLFHLFLYLCTLEILPLVYLAKFADKYFFS